MEYCENRCETCVSASWKNGRLFCQTLLDQLPVAAPVCGGVEVEPLGICSDYDPVEGLCAPVSAAEFNGVQAGTDYPASMGRAI